MNQNEFGLRNIAGGSGGNYRLSADGTLSNRALRALANPPLGGWDIIGPAAEQASAQWVEHEEGDE